MLRLNMPEPEEFVAGRNALECGVDPKTITATGEWEEAESAVAATITQCWLCPAHLLGLAGERGACGAQAFQL
jgi:hypothetical protein